MRDEFRIIGCSVLSVGLGWFVSKLLENICVCVFILGKYRTNQYLCTVYDGDFLRALLVLSVF